MARILEPDFTNLHLFRDERHLISAAIRRVNLEGNTPKLTSANIQDFLWSVRPPRDPLEAADLVLLYLVKIAGTTGRFVSVNPDNDFPVTCCRSKDEFSYHLQFAMSLELLDGTLGALRPSVMGWRRLTDLRKEVVNSMEAFVAMHFAKELNILWERGIHPAITETGYDPIRVDVQQFNEKICDHIVAAIKRCAFLVADVTNQRQGVYFEAGLAMGLGKPVIWMVRKNDVENIHFDTRQYNHIVWQTPEEARDRLRDRIQATIPAIHTKAGGHQDG
jgi:hypothetical protein